jgi:hypothetical protein
VIKKSQILVISIITLLSGCIETSKSVISLNDDFKNAGNGKMVATVESSGDQLSLEGTINLTEGEFNIYLSNPSGDTIYSETFMKPGKYQINQKFDRLVGDWVFSYTIVPVDEVTPSGSFDFDLIYND